MSDSSLHELRWRGRLMGPYRMEEILKKLDEHEIGLWHEIHQGEQWVPLGEVLETLKKDSVIEMRAVRPFPTAQDAVTLPAVPSLRTSTRQAEPIPAPEVVNPTRAIDAKSKPLNLFSPSAGRSRKGFVALGLLLGFVGAHNFYAGYWGTAAVQIILSAVTWTLGFGIIIPWLWAFIELLVVRTDARGRPMK